MKRVSKPRNSAINGGKGITIRSKDVHFPTFENRIKFDFDGKEAFLIIVHDYDPASGYFVSAALELDGRPFDVDGWEQKHGDDGWTDYVYSQFRGEFMANLHTLKLPHPFVKMIEERLAYMAGAEVA